ncbi:cysteine desulfurase [Vibrio vulnificus]|uniref:cysteine desulfurase family protein n=1 Tax=Vibrio vulnificus TaxID=672 RepID=UPI001023D90D|nr:cysteine desulfurase family protein [Vibrio vulnificus]MCU8312658.1 cysteine desulfurase [Vibrio vulnificus]RZP99617.1 cysteine desulfurase [Vibrio vulnificus]RZQ46885.1 cysteine desulfurase [Vibrio vulnificus]HAS8241045.1 cysteine desulfurase [Vibrio vulnificus]
MNTYFDYAASTPVSQSVLDSMKPWEHEKFANASSAHQAGRACAQEIQKARECIAEKIGALPSEIIFTSGASEANNLALKGVAFKHLENKGHIITSEIEHKCILSTCAFLESIGFDVTYLTPDCNGRISPSSLAAEIRSDTILISIHHVNNELGTIQPIQEFGAIAFEHNIPFHTDAAQSFCKCDIDVDDMDIDMLSLSGHKIYGPKGIGALYVRDARDSELVPLIHGGGQEAGLRGGTSPTPLIVGLATAVKCYPTTANPIEEYFLEVMSQFDFTRNGGLDVVPSTWSVTFRTDEEVKRFMSDYPWLISQGSACNALSNAASHVLTAIGMSEEIARRTYRISLPPYQLSER